MNHIYGGSCVRTSAPAPSPPQDDEYAKAFSQDWSFRRLFAPLDGKFPYLNGV